ncbi:GRIP and coiled-coil domain-containing protein 1 [Vespa crabro]|uniref:GRIP and coiled-coil domain-containing protein 1 n=1 Tax=Vespa crabro TaxID=7445 RepID=UPI001F01E2A5|nr:GRIP and coiled-coil domain-containing protein 1 [Vespa crabro]XP_046835566.1 GRIP and coiled-coil domain-containing protein 1 [Vespa crabro]XP_046835567.1 GRIP and coiled-coil domain-containing protein 1 [Vespa crabro]
MGDIKEKKMGKNENHNEEEISSASGNTQSTDIQSTDINKEQTKTNKSSGKSKNVEAIDAQQSLAIQRDTETVKQLKNQLETLMNSLATLSAEKSKMEANFQSDRKQLRMEREECEKVIRELKEKLKKGQNHNVSEIEHVKCKLIMERHEREKERANHASTIKELQKILNEELRNKEQLEQQMKNLFANKTQCKILEAELEITKNKLKQAEEAAKETPPLLLSLQAEMVAIKKQHRYAILEEQRRAATAEQQARTLAMTHETRVAGLESRLAELSETVGEYDRLRQQDQRSIQNLKDQLSNMQDVEHKECVNMPSEPEEIISKIKILYGRLLYLDNKKEDSAYVESLLKHLELNGKYNDSEYKEKYETLLQEFKMHKEQVPTKYDVDTSLLRKGHQQIYNLMDLRDKENIKTQLHLLKTHNNNLEERIRTLNSKLIQKEKELQIKIDYYQQLLQEERAKSEHVLSQKENEFRSKICTLEQQLLRQRERSVALVQEKEKEILTLKASFHALIPKKDPSFWESERNVIKSENKSESSGDIVTGLLNNDSPPILHYTQELARHEVQISSTRKRILELEALLREKERQLLHITEKHKEELKAVQTQVARLEACKSREGANLEYLKNVLINYLTTNDSSSKRHILNAISTVLQFTSDELEKVNHVK